MSRISYVIFFMKKKIAFLLYLLVHSVVKTQNVQKVARSFKYLFSVIFHLTSAPPVIPTLHMSFKSVSQKKMYNN